jgi:MYXO-CTERM domain-containing protein
MRWWWTAALLAGCLGDHDPPELLDLQPVDGTDLRGVADVASWAVYRDESDVEARLFVDGALVATPETRCGDKSCQADFVWSTLDFAPGPHDMALSLEDAAGNVTAATRQVRFDDVLTVTSMRVSNIVDDSGTLEIEVYAFDATNTMIGCAGSRHGLATVDNAGIVYDTQAVLITPDRLAFGTLDAGAGPFRLEVWEDDDAPVCPEPLDPALNDLVGKSPMLTVDQWRTTPLSSFDNVTKLGVAWGRTLDQGEAADPPLLTPDPYSNGGTGCQSTGGRTGVLWLVGLCALLVRRRRVRG